MDSQDWRSNFIYPTYSFTKSTICCLHALSLCFYQGETLITGIIYHGVYVSSLSIFLFFDVMLIVTLSTIDHLPVGRSAGPVLDWLFMLLFVFMVTYSIKLLFLDLSLSCSLTRCSLCWFVTLPCMFNHLWIWVSVEAIGSYRHRWKFVVVYAFRSLCSCNLIILLHIWSILFMLCCPS